MWTFLLAAHAQQELCEPLPAAVLDARLDALTRALAEARVDDVFEELLASRDEARCLDAPIEPDLLARLAWLHAEYAVFDQDEEDFWRWVRLARDTAPAYQLPAHIAEDHPLRRFLASPPEVVPVSGPDRAINHPKKGGVYLDGRRIDSPAVRGETPHLVQVFENKVLLDGYWQSGARFRPELLADPLPVAAAVVQVEEATVGPAGWKPARKDTVKAWEKWIVANPDSEWLDEARGRLDDVRFREAEAGGEASLRAYLAADPGRNARAARAALERIDFDRTAAENTRQAWALYLGRHPGGVYESEAMGRLDELTWLEMRAKDTEEAYARYLTQHRDGAHREEARALLAERAWDTALASGDAGQLRRFIARFPRSPRRPEARARLAGTRFGAVNVALDGCEPCALALITAVDAAGLRAERIPRPSTSSGAKVGEGTALLWVGLEPLAEGRMRASAELWTAIGGGALASWSAEAADEAALAAALVKGLPDLARWK